MTLKEIEKTRYFLTNIETVQGLTETQKLVAEIRGFYGEDFNVDLRIKIHNTIDSYTSEYEVRDKVALKGFLERCLAKENNTDIICEILDLIREGENLNDNKNERYKFISKIYHSYNGKIKFDEAIDLIATAPKDAIMVNGYANTKEMVSGIVVKLRSYANELIQATNRKGSVGNKQEINFHPHINLEAKNETNINIVAIFKDARQQAEDSGLPDEQYKVIMEKLSELEQIANNKESKGKRWQKVKEFMKWLAEQGIQVAGILLPVLANVIQ